MLLGAQGRVLLVIDKQRLQGREPHQGSRQTGSIDVAQANVAARHIPALNIQRKSKTRARGIDVECVQARAQ